MSSFFSIGAASAGKSNAVNAMLTDYANTERESIISSAIPRTPTEQRALDAALFERAKAERYECALRHALCSLERGHIGTATAEIRIALLSIQ